MKRFNFEDIMNTILIIAWIIAGTIIVIGGHPTPFQYGIVVFLYILERIRYYFK